MTGRMPAQDESVQEAKGKYEFGPATGKESYPGGYADDARMILYIITDLMPRIRDDELARDVMNAMDRIDNNSASKADIALIMDIYKDIVAQGLDKPYKDAVGKFDQNYDPNAGSDDDLDEGRVKGWVMDMEEDAADMTREEFIKKHGASHADIWDRVHSEEDEYEPEPDFESVQEGTEMGQIGDVHIKQFGMGKGQVGIQLTSDKGQGYVQLNKEDAAKLAARLARWAGSSELAQPGEYESVNEEVSDEVYVDKSFNASMNLINRMEGKFSPGKALGRKIDAIGGDSSTLKDIAEALGNVYEALEDGHYNAMGHIQGESKK